MLAGALHTAAASWRTVRDAPKADRHVLPFLAGMLNIYCINYHCVSNIDACRCITHSCDHLGISQGCA